MFILYFHTRDIHNARWTNKLTNCIIDQSTLCTDNQSIFSATKYYPHPTLIHIFIKERQYSNDDYGTSDDFTAKWTTFFTTQAYDRFELNRGLNNCFSYDIVPPVEVVEAALRAARRLNDFATAVRIFGGLKEKTENDQQYEMYLKYLRPLMDELGVCTPEELGRE